MICPPPPQTQIMAALMEQCACEEAPPPTRAVWSSASTQGGGPSVTMVGIMRLQGWCAINLDTPVLLVGVVSTTGGCGE